MKLWKGVLASLLLLTPAAAQQLDPNKLLPVILQQRNQVMDAWAQCLVNGNELQVKIVELQKQLDDLKKEQK